MSTARTSPRKIRPYTPFVTRRRSLSPPPDIDIGCNSTPLPSSSGMFLLIRNVLPSSDKRAGFGKPVDLVKKAIDEAIESSQGNELSDISVTVIPGGRPQDQHCSSAYLELAQEVKSLYPVPRPDLLIDWINALTKVRPLWEVVWAPQKKGKDRRMTVRFCVADSKEKVPANAADKIRAYLETKGHKTTGGYISFNGLVDISMADTHSVDTILSHSHFIIPSITKEGMHVSAPKFIPILHPFELCISGLNEYEGLHDVINKWLHYKYVRDDFDKNPRVFETRLSDDRDCFIFAMDSWESTLAVLKDTEAFRSYFLRSPLISEPKLLFDLNSSGFTRKSTSSAIAAGAGLVNEAIADLKRDLNDFRNDQNKNNNMVQRQVAVLHADFESQSTAVAAIGNQIHQFGMSFLAGRDEKAIEGRIFAIDNLIMFESVCLRTTTNPAQISAIESKMLDLQEERRELSLKLCNASDITLKLAGVAPGTNFPQLPIQRKAINQAPITINQPAPPITQPFPHHLAC